MKQGLFPLLLAVLVLLVGGTASWAVVDAFVLSPARSLNAQIFEAEGQIAGLRSRSAQLSAELASLPTMAAGGQPPSAGEIPLSEAIVPLLESNDGQVLSSESLTTRRGVGLGDSVRVHARFSENGLIDLLNQLAIERPDVVISAMSVHTLPLPPEARPLDVTITLSRPD